VPAKKNGQTFEWIWTRSVYTRGSVNSLDDDRRVVGMPASDVGERGTSADIPKRVPESIQRSDHSSSRAPRSAYHPRTGSRASSINRSAAAGFPSTVAWMTSCQRRFRSGDSRWKWWRFCGHCPAPRRTWHLRNDLVRVNEQRREFAIRLALGVQRRDIPRDGPAPGTSSGCGRRRARRGRRASSSLTSWLGYSTACHRRICPPSPSSLSR